MFLHHTVYIKAIFIYRYIKIKQYYDFSNLIFLLLFITSNEKFMFYVNNNSTQG